MFLVIFVLFFGVAVAQKCSVSQSLLPDDMCFFKNTQTSGYSFLIADFSGGGPGLQMQKYTPDCGSLGPQGSPTTITVTTPAAVHKMQYSARRKKCVFSSKSGNLGELGETGAAAFSPLTAPLSYVVRMMPSNSWGDVISVFSDGSIYNNTAKVAATTALNPTTVVCAAMSSNTQLMVLGKLSAGADTTSNRMNLITFVGTASETTSFTFPASETPVACFSHVFSIGGEDHYNTFVFAQDSPGAGLVISLFQSDGSRTVSSLSADFRNCSDAIVPHLTTTKIYLLCTRTAGDLQTAVVVLGYTRDTMPHIVDSFSLGASFVPTMQLFGAPDVASFVIATDPVAGHTSMLVASDCLPGTYRSNAATTVACSSCPTGFYSNAYTSTYDQNDMFCTPCENLGSKTDFMGCEACPPAQNAVDLVMTQKCTPVVTNPSAGVFSYQFATLNTEDVAVAFAVPGVPTSTDICKFQTQAGSNWVDLIFDCHDGRMDFGIPITNNLSVVKGNSDSGSWTIRGTATRMNVLLTQMSMRGANDRTGTVPDNACSITLRTAAGCQTTTSQFKLTMSFDLAGVNDFPAVTLYQSTLTLAEDTASVSFGLNVTDVDIGNGLLETTISCDHGMISITNPPSCQVAVVGGNGSFKQTTIVISGEQNCTSQALASVGYIPTADYYGSDSIRITVNDRGCCPNSAQGGAAPAAPPASQIAVTITPVNDAPVLTMVVGPLNVDEDNALVFNDLDFATGQYVRPISVADVDALAGATDAASRVTVTMTALHGNITLLQTGGLVSFSGNNAPTMSFAATPDVITNAIRGMKYLADTNYFGSDTLTVRIVDATNSAVTKSVSINVMPINDPPVITSPAAGLTPLLVRELVSSSIFPSSVTIVDVDSAVLTVTLTVSTGSIFVDTSYSRVNSSLVDTSLTNGLSISINSSQIAALLPYIMYLPPAQNIAATDINLDVSDGNITVSRRPIISVTTCASGSFVETVSKTCQPCARGTYGPRAGLSACISCPAGSYQKLTGQISCDPCEVGTFMGDAAASSCTDCGPGTFANITGKASCDSCPEGTFADTSKTINCRPCVGGSFTSTRGKTACDSCIAGTFAAEAGSRICADCPAGTFSVAGASKCENCGLGSYSTGGAFACTLCPTGSFSSSTNASTCEACPANSVTPGSGSGSIKDCNCLRGYYGAAGTACTACPEGGFCESADGTTGLRYPVAKEGYWRKPGTTDQFYACTPAEACAGGSITSQDPPSVAVTLYSNHPYPPTSIKMSALTATIDSILALGSTSALSRTGITYSNVSQNSNSTANGTTDASSSTSSSSSSSSSSTSSSTSTSSSATTSGSTPVVLNTTYTFTVWIATGSSDTVARMVKSRLTLLQTTVSTDEMIGFVKNAFGLSGNTSYAQTLSSIGIVSSDLVAHNDAASVLSEDTCATGYSGSRCGDCATNYYRLSERCEPCPKTSAGTVALMSVTVVALAIVLLLLGRSAHSLGSVAIAVNFFQAVALLRGFNLGWPSLVRRILDYMSIFNFNISLMHPECDIKITYMDKLRLIMALPLVILLCFGVSLVLVWLWHGFIHRIRNSSEENRIKFARWSETSMIRRWVLMGQVDPVTGRDISLVYARYCIINSTLMLLLLTYTFLSTAALEYFACDENADGTFTMLKNPSLNCYETDWNNNVWLPALGLVFYTFGIPLIIFYILFRNRTQIRKDIAEEEEQSRKEALSKLSRKERKLLREAELEHKKSDSPQHATGASSSPAFEKSRSSGSHAAAATASSLSYKGKVYQQQTESSGGAEITTSQSLHLNKEEQRQNLTVAMFCGALYSKYERAFWYWVIFEMLRKLGLIIAQLYFSKKAVYQAMGGLCVLQIALLLQTWGQPFVETRLDRLEFATILCLFLVLLFGLVVTPTDAPTESETHTMSILIAIALIACLVIIVYTFFSEMHELAEKALKILHKRQQQKKKNADTANTAGAAASSTDHHGHRHSRHPHSDNGDYGDQQHGGDFDDDTPKKPHKAGKHPPIMGAQNVRVSPATAEYMPTEAIEQAFVKQAPLPPQPPQSEGPLEPLFARGTPVQLDSTSVQNLLVSTGSIKAAPVLRSAESSSSLHGGGDEGYPPQEPKGSLFPPIVQSQRKNYKKFDGSLPGTAQ